MTISKDHISICICTFKRISLLKRVLSKIEDQAFGHPFDCSVVVVDNDCVESAKETILTFKEKTQLPVDYYIEPEKNISLARNMAIRSSKGNIIVFIDDDEFPGEGWLHHLYKTYKEFSADCVLGPVKPCFNIEPPKWVTKGKLHERESFETGTIIKDHRYTRTGNVLISRKILNDNQVVFNPLYGRSGGEDTEFFRRKINDSCILVWCDQACVYESIPPERLKRSYFLKRALLRGVVSGRNSSFYILDTMKSFAAFILYTLSLPFLFFAGHHLFMKYLIKDFDHIGKLLSICGIELIKERNF